MAEEKPGGGRVMGQASGCAGAARCAPLPHPHALASPSAPGSGCRRRSARSGGKALAKPDASRMAHPSRISSTAAHDADQVGAADGTAVGFPIAAAAHSIIRGRPAGGVNPAMQGLIRLGHGIGICSPLAMSYHINSPPIAPHRQRSCASLMKTETPVARPCRRGRRPVPAHPRPAPQMSLPHKRRGRQLHVAAADAVDQIAGRHRHPWSAHTHVARPVVAGMIARIGAPNGRRRRNSLAGRAKPRARGRNRAHRRASTLGHCSVTLPAPA